jgi:hypothetical protein
MPEQLALKNLLQINATENINSVNILLAYICPAMVALLPHTWSTSARSSRLD